MNQHKVRGTVLIMSLMVLVIISALATFIVYRSTATIALTRNLNEKKEAQVITDALVVWATTTLAFNSDESVEQMPLQYPDSVIDNANAKATLIDMQGRFNINNLSDRSYFDVFKRLLAIVSPEFKNSDALAREIRGWVTEYHMGSSQLDERYRDEDYFPLHHPITELTTLKLVHGMTPELFAALEPYLFAANTLTAININSADKAVLMALIPGLTNDQSQSLLDESFQSPQAFLDKVRRMGHSFNYLNLLTSKSQYFRLDSEVAIGQTISRTSTFLERNGQATGVRVSVLWQN